MENVWTDPKIIIIIIINKKKIKKVKNDGEGPNWKLFVGNDPDWMEHTGGAR